MKLTLGLLGVAAFEIFCGLALYAVPPRQAPSTASLPQIVGDIRCNIWGTRAFCTQGANAYLIRPHNPCDRRRLQDI
jgi:hypothetical protein